MVEVVLLDGYEWPTLSTYPIWSSLGCVEVCGGCAGVTAVCLGRGCVACASRVY